MRNLELDYGINFRLSRWGDIVLVYNCYVVWSLRQWTSYGCLWSRDLGI